MLQRCRVVLLRPHYPGNLGATARVMHNFGLEELVLVTPVALPTELEALRLATHSEWVLHQARVVATLDEALSDCVQVFGTSAKIEGIYRETRYGRPDELLQTLALTLREGPCALVFGPEPSGLTTEELARCHGIIRILTNPEHPVLNLGQAVAICLYELRKQWLLSQGTASEPTQKIAPFAEQERMFEHLKQALEAVHFLFGEKGDSLMQAIRHLIVRARPGPNEVRILHGLARQLLYVARTRSPSTTTEEQES